MNTKIIGRQERFFNRFTEVGRLKNKMYDKLNRIGMNEIRERKVSKDKFVLMGSRVLGKGFSDITLGVDAKKGYIQKQTNLRTIFKTMNMKVFEMIKIASDFYGNIESIMSLNKTLEKGKTKSSVLKFEKVGKYKKISEFEADKNIKRTVEKEYLNGDFYKYNEFASGERRYCKKIKGKEYVFSNKRV